MATRLVKVESDKLVLTESETKRIKNFKVVLVVSQWNQQITENLFRGAFTTLTNNGILSNNIERLNVPGSFELIYGSKLAQQRSSDIVIAIGSIIRGETSHFDYICQSVAHGIKDLNVKGDVPIIFCVLTDDTLEQAQARSGGTHGNKGIGAAIASIQMALLKP